MSEQTNKINIIELLMGIKSDVSSIKTDMANFKEVQRSEKEIMMKEISAVRLDNDREIKDLESRVMGRLNTLQSVQTSLVGDVDVLKHSDDEKDAHKWRTTVYYLLATFGGMLMAKVPDFISFILKVK